MRVGLTGGIGSGKSTVAALFQRLGVPIIDTDLIAREVVRPGQSALSELVADFGPGILEADQTLDRPALRRLVFADPTARARVQEILHPRIRAVMEKRVDELASPYCILIIPLLLETGQQDTVDRVLVVDVPEAVQVERTCLRDGMGEEDARRVLQAQVDRSIRLEAAHDVIDNTGPARELEARVAELHRLYLDLAGG